MKNFLAFDNLILEEKDSISNFIKASSEVSECSITNVLEDNSGLIWISSEELPQEIIINLSHTFLKEFPKKLIAIGIYCWHAYPTNPKLVEILISKNDDNNFISFGNFDLCLKPGRQLLQLDEENDKNFLITENNNYTIKIIIKETYGDKRTYINNIYLYETIDFVSTGKMNYINTIETIKEEDDSSSIFYLRESRERTLPRKNKNLLKNNNINNNQNIVIKVNDEEINNKDLTIDEFEIITKTKVKDNKFINNTNSNDKINLNDAIINNTYDHDESNININNNIFGKETQFNATLSQNSDKNNNLKEDDLENENILQTKQKDNINGEGLNDSNSRKNNEEDKKNIKLYNDNKIKKENTSKSSNESLSSMDLEPFDLIKGTKTHHNNFFNPPKLPEINDEELDNVEFQHSTSEFKFKTKNDILNKKFSENYFNIQNSNDNIKSQISNKNSNNLSQNSKNNNKQEISKNNIEKYKNNNENINQLKEEILLLKNEFQNYKNQQEEINKKYQNKIIILESHIKKLQINSNKMNDVVKTLLEAQYIQNQTNNDYLLGQMRKIASETFVNIFSNISQLANMIPNPSPSITIQNPNQNRQITIPFNENIINMNEERPKQQTYQTTRRKMYSIDKIGKQQNNYSINNNINNNIINNNVNNGFQNIYNRKLNDDLNIRANKLKKYNSGRNIVLRKNYVNQHLNKYINYENQNNNSLENFENIKEDQQNNNLFYQTGYPTEINKNPFKKNTNINNINSNELLKINNNNYNSNILTNKKEIIHRRIPSNTYKKKNTSPIKKIKQSYITYIESAHLFPQTTVNSSNQNKSINFNLNVNQNEEKEESEEKEEEEKEVNKEKEEEEKEENEAISIDDLSSNDDAPLKISQLKTEKRHYNINKIINDNKYNYNEDRENDKENGMNSIAGETFSNFRNKFGEKLNEEITKCSLINKHKFNNDKNIITNEEKAINKKKKNTVKNESLIRLIHQYNNNKDKNKENKEEST